MVSKKLFSLCFLIASTTLFAADNVVREDLTPPPLEGALTISQIPPISSLGKPAARPTNSTTTTTTTLPTPPPPSQIIMGQ